MSTRGTVAIKENGRYKYISNHRDSNIDSLGITLYQHYQDTNKIRALINLGNTSFIGSELEKDSETIAYVRDEGCDWEKEKPRETENIKEVLSETFTYIFDLEENKWYMAYQLDNYMVRELEKVLHSKVLLEQLFGDDYYTKSYMPKFYEKCLKA